MKKLFQKFIKNKYFIFWIILFTIILYIIFNPLLRDTTEYMQIRKITEYRYIFAETKVDPKEVHFGLLVADVL